MQRKKNCPKRKRFSLFKKSLNRTKIFLLSPKRPNTHFRVTDARPRLNLASNWFRWCAVASVINYSSTSECISLSVVSFIILSTISYEDITRLYRWWDGMLGYHRSMGSDSDHRCSQLFYSHSFHSTFNHRRLRLDFFLYGDARSCNFIMICFISFLPP